MITIDSSATGTLETTVEAGATLITRCSCQDTLTIRPNGRVMIKPGGSVANLLTGLTIEPVPAQAAVDDHAHVATTDIHPVRLLDVRSAKTIAIEDRRQSKRAARGQFGRPT